jgi:hypothetical protein
MFLAMARANPRSFCWLMLAALLAGAAVASAQSSHKAPVAIIHSGNDVMGQRLAFEIREVVRGSQSMRLVSINEADPCIVVHLVSVDPTVNNSGMSTAMAVTIAYDSNSIPVNGYLLNTVVQTCGSSRAQDCARGIAGDIDSAIELLHQKWPTLWTRLK